MKIYREGKRIKRAARVVAKLQKKRDKLAKKQEKWERKLAKREAKLNEKLEARVEAVKAMELEKGLGAVAIQ